MFRSGWAGNSAARASAYAREADVAGATATRVRCGAAAVNVDMRSPFGSRSPSLHRRRYPTEGRTSTAFAYCGWGTIRMYGFGDSHSPNVSLASSSETDPAMITLSP